MIKAQHAADAGFPVACAEEKKRGEFARILVERIAVLDARFRAAIVVAQLDVHDPGNGIGAINARCSVLQNFNAFDGGARDRIKIDEGHRAVTGAHGIGRDATTVD